MEINPSPRLPAAWKRLLVYKYFSSSVSLFRNVSVHDNIALWLAESFAYTTSTCIPGFFQGPLVTNLTTDI
jgi:hypothetical protein